MFSFAAVAENLTGATEPLHTMVQIDPRNAVTLSLQELRDR